MSISIESDVKRIDAYDKVSGQTTYVGDMVPESMLYARPLRATKTHANIISVTLPDLPEGYTFVSAKDIPQGGSNQVAMINNDWQAFAAEITRYKGEIIGLMVGPNIKELISLIKGCSVVYKELPAVTTIEEALTAEKEGNGAPIYQDGYLFGDFCIEKGDAKKGLSKATKQYTYELRTGYQEHVYLEPQSMLALLEEGRPVLYASCQCPFYLQHACDSVLGDSYVSTYGKTLVKVPAVGGAFGGKEHFPDIIGPPLLLAAIKTGKPVQLIFDREEDIAYTVKRHPSKSNYTIGVDKNDQIVGMDITMAFNSGAYQSSSNVVMSRGIFSANSVYDIHNSAVRGLSVATNMVPSDAFRGFGAPQACFASDMAMFQLARDLGKDDLAFREQYFLKQGSSTSTNGVVRDVVVLPEMVARLKEISGYQKKNSMYVNGSGRGIAISLYNHGGGFTGDGEQSIIRGKATLSKERNNHVTIRISTLDMGQGLKTTFSKIVADILEIPMEQISCIDPTTDTVPDSGPTVASRSMMVVGRLVELAARKLKEQWKDGEIQEVTQQYSHPSEFQWDQASMQGDAYPTYSWGAIAVEVSIDPLTYEVKTEGVWCIHDIGKAIDEQVVEGQVIGGVVQALGYGSIEKMEVKDGSFYQGTLADYMIPTSMEFPPVVSELINSPYAYGPFGAKGMGELVHDGAATAFAMAVEKATNKRVSEIPVTPEMVMRLMEEGSNE